LTRPHRIVPTVKFHLSPIYHTIQHLFYFNDTATTEIYTLSLHDALPISGSGGAFNVPNLDLGTYRVSISAAGFARYERTGLILRDRKSTRLNSSHVAISYAVFCLKKKIKKSNLTGQDWNQ